MRTPGPILDAHPPLLVSSVSLGFPFIAITAFLFCFHRPRADVIAYHIATNRSWQGITLREATMKGSLIMHFKQLEAFVNVIKFKSFSKAAEEIYLSQPTISAHISALESEFGTKLIIRSTKEVYPSKAGKIFYEYASEMLRMRDKAILSVKSCATDIRGTLEIAASTVPSQYLLPELLPQMAKDYPNLFFELKQYDSREVANHIINMDAEIGIVGTQLEKNKCVFEPFASDQLVLITPNLEKYRELKGDFPLSMLIPFRPVLQARRLLPAQPLLPPYIFINSRGVPLSGTACFLPISCAGARHLSRSTSSSISAKTEATASSSCSSSTVS